MAALVSMFNFLIVHLRFIVCICFGGTFGVNSFAFAEQKEMATFVIESFTNGECSALLNFDGVPMLYIPIGIFVIGAVVGLAKRLIRG